MCLPGGELERAGDHDATPTAIGTTRASAAVASRPPPAPHPVEKQQFRTQSRLRSTRCRPAQSASSGACRLGWQSSGDSATAWARTTAASCHHHHQPHADERQCSAHPCLSRHRHPRHRHRPAAGHRHSPIADMEPHQKVVSVALATKSSAEAPKNACCEVLSKVMGHHLLSRNWLLTTAMLLITCRTRRVGATREHSRYAPSGHDRAMGTCPRGRRALAHRWNMCGRSRRLRGRCAHARSLANVGRRVGSAHSREGPPIGRRARDLGPFLSACSQWRLGPIVVFDAALALLLLRVRSAEVKIEVTADRGGPRERPAHPTLVGLLFPKGGA